MVIDDTCADLKNQANSPRDFSIWSMLGQKAQEIWGCTLQPRCTKNNEQSRAIAKCILLSAGLAGASVSSQTQRSFD